MQADAGSSYAHTWKHWLKCYVMCYNVASGIDAGRSPEDGFAYIQCFRIAVLSGQQDTAHWAEASSLEESSSSKIDPAKRVW